MYGITVCRRLLSMTLMQSFSVLVPEPVSRIIICRLSLGKSDRVDLGILQETNLLDVESLLVFQDLAVDSEIVRAREELKG